MQRRTQRNQAGQAVVETALAMPVILAMIIALVTCGLLFNSLLLLNHACRQGTRASALGQSPAAVRTLVAEALAGSHLDPNQASVTLQGPGATGLVTVKVTYPLDLPMPIPGLANPFPLKAQATMRAE